MIPPEEAHLLFSGKSHHGLGGKPNQDRYQVVAQVAGASGRPSTLAVLTDGIGGRRAGDVAAQLALDTVVSAVAQSHASQPTGILQAAFIQAGQAVLARSEEDPQVQGMGSTCLAAWVLGDRLYSASIGNSRLYLLRRGRLQQLNVPHEFAREEERSSDADEQQAQQGRGKLRAFLGSHLPIEPDFRLLTRPNAPREGSQRGQGLRLRPNDRLLLCSDGLSDVLDEEQIAAQLGQGEADEVADRLVDAVLEAGGSDNVTAVVLAMPPALPASAQRGYRPGRRWAAAVVASLLLVLISLVAWYFWVPRLDPGYTPEPSPLPTHTPAATGTLESNPP